LCLVSVARAALLNAVLKTVVHGVEGLDERGGGLRAGVGLGALGVGLGDGSLDGGGVAAAARLLLGGLAGGLLALELTLGLGAVDGLHALVVAVELLAHRGALGLGRLASGVAAGGLADSLALGARVLLARLLGATDGADRALAVDGALSAGSLFTLHLTIGAGTHGVAHGGALGVIALPFAVGVALLGNSHDSQQGNQKGNVLHL